MPLPDTAAPETRSVPTGILRLLLAHAKAGQMPKVAYQESHQAMTYAAIQIQKDQLKEIETIVTDLLGD